MSSWMKALILLSAAAAVADAGLLINKLVYIAPNDNLASMFWTSNPLFIPQPASIGFFTSLSNCVSTLNNMFNPDFVKSAIQKRISYGQQFGQPADFTGVCNYTITCSDLLQPVALKYSTLCLDKQTVTNWTTKWTQPPAPGLQYPFSIHRWIPDPRPNAPPNNIIVSATNISNFIANCENLVNIPATTLVALGNGSCVDPLTANTILEWRVYSSPIPVSRKLLVDVRPSRQENTAWGGFTLSLPQQHGTGPSSQPDNRANDASSSTAWRMGRALQQMKTAVMVAPSSTTTTSTSPVSSFPSSSTGSSDLTAR